MTGLVYFIQRGDGGPIKIGTTTDLDGRLRALQTGSAELLRVLATVPGGEKQERDLHCQFSSFRKGGEWFVPNPELLALIQGARLAVGRPAPGLVARAERVVPAGPVVEAADGSRAALDAIDEIKDAGDFPLRKRTGR